MDPWLIAAAERGATVRWVRVDPETLTLDPNDLEQKINEHTKLVAVGLASNAVGTVNDVAAIADRAHEAGALVAVDAVHAAPHIPIDRERLGADILTCSAYKFFGPHVGVTAVRRDLLEELGVYRLDPAPDYAPDRLETGTQNHEGIAGVKGALDFISSLGYGASPRERFVSAMQTIEEHETALAEDFRAALREIPGVKLYAAPDGVRKTPTIAFRVEGRTPRRGLRARAQRRLLYSGRRLLRLDAGREARVFWTEAASYAPASPRTTPRKKSRGLSSRWRGL